MEFMFLYILIKMYDFEFFNYYVLPPKKNHSNEKK